MTLNRSYGYAVICKIVNSLFLNIIFDCRLSRKGTYRDGPVQAGSSEPLQGSQE